MIDIERYTELIEEISDMQVAIKDRTYNRRDYANRKDYQ